jgi:hypothetical protein
VPATYVRLDAPQGGCAVLAVGQSPESAVRAAAHTPLPGFRAVDAGRTLDEYGGLCSLTLRERDPAGSVLVVVIAASTQTAWHGVGQPTVSHTSTTTGSVTAVHLETEDGWSVTVGTLGPRTDQPSSADLLAVAQNPAIRW